jgi:hypothetical protein
MAEKQFEQEILYAGSPARVLWYDDGHLRIIDKDTGRLITRKNPTENYDLPFS